MFESLDSRLAIEHVDIRKSLPAVGDCGTNELIELAYIVGLEREQIKTKEI